MRPESLVATLLIGPAVFGRYGTLRRGGLLMKRVELMSFFFLHDDGPGIHQYAARNADDPVAALLDEAAFGVGLLGGRVLFERQLLFAQERGHVESCFFGKILFGDQS